MARNARGTTPPGPQAGRAPPNGTAAPMGLVKTALVYVAVGLGALVTLPWDIRVLPGPLPHPREPTPASQAYDAEQHSRDILTFDCSGEQCEAWLYLPKAPAGTPPPVVVMAHGLGQCPPSSCRAGAAGCRRPPSGSSCSSSPAAVVCSAILAGQAAPARGSDRMPPAIAVLGARPCAPSPFRAPASRAAAAPPSPLSAQRRARPQGWPCPPPLTTHPPAPAALRRPEGHGSGQVRLLLCGQGAGSVCV
jgi:hypothetical protein